MTTISIWGVDPSLTSTGISNGVENTCRIQTHPTSDTLDAPGDLMRRVNIICDNIQMLTRRCHELHLYLESPKLYSAAANHLYEAGWLYHELFCRAQGTNTKIIMVNPATLKTFVCGKGNASADQLALYVLKKWGVMFDDDPKHDKAHAFALYQYGVAVESGTIEHHAPKRRGKGEAAVATERRKRRNRQGEV